MEEKAKLKQPIMHLPDLFELEPEFFETYDIDNQVKRAISTIVGYISQFETVTEKPINPLFRMLKCAPDGVLRTTDSGGIFNYARGNSVVLGDTNTTLQALGSLPVNTPEIYPFLQTLIIAESNPAIVEFYQDEDETANVVTYLAKNVLYTINLPHFTVKGRNMVPGNNANVKITSFAYVPYLPDLRRRSITQVHGRTLNEY